MGLVLGYVQHALMVYWNPIRKVILGRELVGSVRATRRAGGDSTGVFVSAGRLRRGARKSPVPCSFCFSITVVATSLRVHIYQASNQPARVISSPRPSHVRRRALRPASSVANLGGRTSSS